MSSFVADTHTVVWYLQGSNRLSETALTTLDAAIEANDRIYVTSISVVEVAYLVEKFRLPEVALDQLIEALSNPDADFVVVSLSLVIAQAMRHISRDIVPDMPDRIIAATALYLNLPLVTRDQRIQALTAIQTIW